MIKEKTLSQLFFERCNQNLNKNVIGWIDNNSMHFYSYEDYLVTVEKISLALMRLGILQNQKVAILSQTCKEWHFMDLGILCARMVSVPIYPNLTAPEIEYILNHCESVCVVIENEVQLEKLIACSGKISGVKQVIVLKPINEELSEKAKKHFEILSYQELLNIGLQEKTNSPKLFSDCVKESDPNDLASIIYTSGTTGQPKGAVITHKAFVAMLNNVASTLKANITPQDRTLTFLPLSHVLGRCDSMLNLIFGFECVYAESLEKVVDNLQIARPTIMIAVPRIFEKVYAKVLENIANESDLKQKVFAWALKASNDYFAKIENDHAPSPLEIIQKNLAYKLVFKKVYDRFGGKVRFLISGGAPLAPDIIKFLQNANLTILEGYGLTETIAPCTLNPVVKQIPGTIGLPLGDVKIQFADDGEIMIRSQALFSSYYKDKESTNAAFNSDGWFLTGDIGEITPEGYIKITDRKKDIIITSGGKNVAPQKIENLLKLKKYIANAMVVGDKKKFLVAIICLDREAFVPERELLGLSQHFSFEEMAQNQKIREAIWQNVAETNQELANFEKIKGIFIAPNDFTVENGHITPSLKLKKKVIMKTYNSEIDALYRELENKHHGA